MCALSQHKRDGTAPRSSPDGRTIYFTSCVEEDHGTDYEILMVRSEAQTCEDRTGKLKAKS